MGRLVVGVGAGHADLARGARLRGASRVVIDFGGVTAIDGGGVGELLRLRQTAARHGIPVIIAAAAPRCGASCSSTRLDIVFGLSSGWTPSRPRVGGGCLLGRAPSEGPHGRPQPSARRPPFQYGGAAPGIHGAARDRPGDSGLVGRLTHAATGEASHFDSADGLVALLRAESARLRAASPPTPVGDLR